MRKTFIAGNWKMNLTVAEAEKLARSLAQQFGTQSQVEVALAPVATALAAVVQACKGSHIGVAGQNCHFEKSGAFTGEISAALLKDIGCSHVILGHSERRQYFFETDEIVNKKVHAAFREGLIPIVCVGETLAQREEGKTMQVVAQQIRRGLQGVAAEDVVRLTIAYEPVWAIGTGKTATPEQAQQVHENLRELLKEMVGQDASRQVRIQYGGSVNPGNAKELLAQPDIDGALVGGASLKAESFSALLMAGMKK